MHLLRLAVGSLAVLLLCTAPLLAGPADPLRLMPDEADVVIEVPKPGKLVEAVNSLDAFQQLLQMDAVKEFLSSANYRRFYQLVGYLEKELGHPWPELIDRLAGGGMALGFKIGPQPAPTLLVIQGTDAKLMAKFANLAFELVEQGAVGDEPKEKTERRSHRKVETVHAGKEFHAAVVGEVLLISNEEKVLHRALDLHLDGPKGSLALHRGPNEARKLLPADPLARLWINLETVQKIPEAKDVFASPPTDPNLMILLGGWLDVARRAPFLCAGLYQQKDGFQLSIRLPAGRQGMNEGMVLHIPPPNLPAPPPLLEPKGVLYSSSFYMDFSKLWEERNKLFNAEQAKAFEELDKQSKAFLSGTELSKLLAQTGTYHRIVVAHPAKTGYKRPARQPIPAFAFVVSLREPAKFAETMDSTLRAAALLGGSQAGLKPVEEKHGTRTIVGYRFPEDRDLPGDTNDIRFAFSPCWVAVGDQFVFCSTVELAHDLVDLLEKEAKAPKSKGPVMAEQTRLYARGGTALLRSIEDVLVTQAVLGQAIEPAVAEKQVCGFLDWLQGLGMVQIDSSFGEKQFNYDLRVILGKK